MGIPASAESVCARCVRGAARVGGGGGGGRWVELWIGNIMIFLLLFF